MTLLAQVLSIPGAYSGRSPCSSQADTCSHPFFFLCFLFVGLPIFFVSFLDHSDAIGEGNSIAHHALVPPGIYSPSLYRAETSEALQPSEKTYLTTNPDGTVSSPKQLPCWFDRWLAQGKLSESYPPFGGASLFRIPEPLSRLRLR